MLHRLRMDFELSIITFFGGCAVFGILPFAGYRFASGDPPRYWPAVLLMAGVGIMIVGSTAD